MSSTNKQIIRIKC